MKVIQISESSTVQYTKEELKEMQSWPLDKKVQASKARIIEWYEYWGGNVCVSFSGGRIAQYYYI